MQTTPTQMELPHVQETVHAGKRTKIERYKWRLVDHPGVFREINKRQLQIDDSYQRAEILPKIRAMASDWSWMACGVILVAHRAGRYYVYDGQQRTASARLRSDISTLPCLVFETESSADEAMAFVGVNTLRKSVEAVWKFRALVAAGDASARALLALIEEQGYGVATHSQNPHSVRCIRAMQRHFDEDDKVLRRIWPLVAKVSGGGPIHEKVLSSLFRIEAEIADQGVTLTKEPWSRRIERLGVAGIVDACGRASAFYARGGAKVWAKGVLEQLNKGLGESKRLRIGDPA